jgi:hypothetical protein
MTQSAAGHREMTSTLDAMLASRVDPETLALRLAPWSANVAGNVFVMRSTGSQWLIDLERRAFQRLAPGDDPRRHLLSGVWTRYEELAFYPADAMLFVDPAGGLPLRTRVRLITTPEPEPRATR